MASLKENNASFFVIDAAGVDVIFLLAVHTNPMVKKHITFFWVVREGFSSCFYSIQLSRKFLLWCFY